MKNYIFFLLLILLTSCASVQINTDYDRAVDFSSVKTFSLYNDSIQVKTMDKELVLKKLTNSLKKKGLAIDDPSDMKVFLKITEEEIDNPNNINTGFGFGGDGVGVGVSVPINFNTTVIANKIWIEFYDSKNSHLIWQGVAEKNFSKRNLSSQRENYLATIFDEILKKYPPKKQ